MRRTLAILLLSTLSITACSSNSSSSSGDSSTAAAASCAPAGGPVTLTFTSWVPDIQKVVDIWNAANPNIQVKVQTGPNGNGGTYQNFFNQLKAGNAPDLGQQDAGPMALFYRKDLFEKNNIKVPATWQEYADAAVKVKAAGGSITNFSTADINQFAGLAWQAGAHWFANDGTNWTVSLADPATTKVAAYWQDLIDKKLVSAVPPWTDEWNNAYNESKAWTWVSAVWGANSIATGAPKTDGKWAVAPMPQWTAGDKIAGNWGGSSTAVFKGSKHPYEAAKFALWLNTSTDALTELNKVAQLYPATKAGATLPALSQGVEFYGGQKIYDEFATASGEVKADFTWGPTMTQTYADASDGFKAAVSGQGTLLKALQDAQASTIKTLKSQSIPVKE